MIYLTSVRLAELTELKARFRASGIPVYVEPDYSVRDTMASGSADTYRSATSPHDWYRINICLDEQLDEAKHLFEDANYEVKAPVDVAKFETTMDGLGANREVEWKLSDKDLNRIFEIILVGFVFWILYAVLTSS
jgi:hypothetical protein